MSIKRAIPVLLAVTALAGLAQTRVDPRSSMNIRLPDDSPVALLSASWGDSTATARGGAMLLELRTALSFRNSTQRRIRGITLLVTAQDLAAGGKASVSVPSLNVGPGEAFPVRVDLRLLRPLTQAGGPLAEVTLDGVLFDDLSFYGPNRLNCRRSMMQWELEARRDRQFFKDVLARSGQGALQQQMLGSLNRQADSAAMQARVTHAPRATNQAGERQVQFAFAATAGAPVELRGGMARILGNELRSPRVFLENRARKVVRSVEVGWLLRDTQGREFVAGATPIATSLAPGRSGSLVQDASFRIAERNGQAVNIEGMRAWLGSIEFEDGSMWIPRRSDYLPMPSPEEQRLAELYRKRGLQALVEELNKF